MASAGPQSAGATARPSGIGPVRVGRRVFLGVIGLSAAGVLLGRRIESALARAGTGVGSLVPGGDHWRIYSVSGTLPEIAAGDWRCTVSGMVDRPVTLTLADLQAMPRVHLVRTFQCVTGWEVTDVHWEGVRLSTILDAVGVQPAAVAVSFDSSDGVDTESLTLDQARLPDVLVADRMLGAPITTPHGGPVRLYVAPMFGYKSLKWLSGIRVVDTVEPGYWEQNGYPVNGWLDGSTGPTDPSLGLS